MSAPNRLLRSSSSSQTVRSSTVGRLRQSFSPNHGLATRNPALPSAVPSHSTSKPLSTLRESNAHNLPEAWFNSTFPRPGSSGPRQPDDNKVKLGKTLRILQERLPTLLQSPLPQEVLSPNISLHLFPSTHPHLPAVSGRVAYKAALWTSPIAWNRVPIIGNVRLEILSERMVRGRATRRQGALDEQLSVKWRTIGGKGKSTWGSTLPNGGDLGAEPGGRGQVGREVWEAPAQNQNQNQGVSVVGASQRPGEGKEFTGLFIFEFDSEGRILSHTIEHVQESGNWEHGVGARVVGLTDWLLGGMRGGREGSDTPCPAFARRDK